MNRNEKEIESSQPSGQSQKKVSLQAGTSQPMRPPVAVLGFAASRLLVPYGNPEHEEPGSLPPLFKPREGTRDSHYSSLNSD
jgi:hypothetical protein